MTTATLSHDAPASAPPASRAWNAGLWVPQLLLAAMFGMAGAMKLTQPLEALAASGLVWVNDVPALLVRFIGLSELLGAIGLVLPAATRIQPRLTPLAAIGLVAVMVLASLFHASRGEWGALPINLVLGSLAALVAWGRSRKAPIAAR
jgi:uncharacterized membrane protein YphA (DoxX/SURF4 family)